VTRASPARMVTMLRTAGRDRQPARDRLPAPSHSCTAAMAAINVPSGRDGDKRPDLEKLTPAIIRVGGGRGFIVEHRWRRSVQGHQFEQRRRLVVTAAHCVPGRVPRALSFAHSWERPTQDCSARSAGRGLKFRLKPRGARSRITSCGCNTSSAGRRRLWVARGCGHRPNRASEGPANTSP
jgi:hypothetical protein